MLKVEKFNGKGLAGNYKWYQSLIMCLIGGLAPFKPINSVLASWMAKARCGQVIMAKARVWPSHQGVAEGEIVGLMGGPATTLRTAEGRS